MEYELNWDQYDWREFEKICFEYVKEVFSAKFYKTKLTRAQKDKGRDIIIKSRKGDFEAWGECKKHNRNVDLSIIGKNIVLALSHQINKAIFFSVSSITLNTKIEILNVAQRYGFDVLFLDGNELNKTILSCKKIANKYFGIEYKKYNIQNTDKICVNSFLSEYPYAEDAKNNTKLQYHLNNGFQIFLHIFVKNIHDKDISKIIISLNNYDNSKLIFYKNDYTHESVLNTHADLLCTFSGLVFSPCNNIILPNLKLLYTFSDGTTEEFASETGILDASDVWKAPYINTDCNDFLIEAKKILKHTIPQKYVRIFFIFGHSGMGKSRLMTEVQNYAFELYYRVIHIDFRSKNEIECINDFIKELLGLPKSKKKLFIDFQEFNNIFLDKNLKPYDIDLIYKFLYKSDDTISYLELSNVILDILIMTTKNDNLLIGIDNIQEMTTDAQLLFSSIVDHCQIINIPVCFLFIQNTERLPEVNNTLISYLKISGENFENYIIQYHCTTLKHSDAILLMQELLHLAPDSKNCLENLFNRIESCPLDILLLTKSLAQISGLFKQIDSYRYIMEPKYFLDTALTISKSTDELVENRLSNLNNTYTENTIYQHFFALVNFFDGNLPSEIFEACKFEGKLLFETNNNLLTKVNYTDNIICFYHEKVYNYFQKRAVILPKYILNTIYNFYIDNPKNEIVNEYIFVKVLILRKEYEDAIDIGLNAIKNFKKSNKNQLICKLCDILQQILNKTTYPKEYFKVIFAKADILLERVNIEEAECLFEEAKKIIDLKNTIFSLNEIIYFYHRYINQKLHTLQYHKALSALKAFENLNISNFKANMIINDRYCVAYYSLGKEEEALCKINYVIQEAEKEKNYTWLSIGCSDKGFVYFYNSKNIQEICNNFERAVNYFYLSDEKDDISRKIEILIQKSLYHLLKKEVEISLETIQEAVLIAEKIFYGYLLVPALNINAFILLKKLDIENAQFLLEKALSYGMAFSNKKALISVYNNMGNIYILKKEYKQAMNYYQAAYEILKNICIPENSLRYIGLLCNIIKTAIIHDDQQLVLNILQDYHMFNDLEKYYIECKECASNISDLFAFYYGVLGIQGFNFLY